MNNMEMLMGCMAQNIKNLLLKLPAEAFEDIEEIRLRANQPLLLKKRKQELFLSSLGTVTLNMKQGYLVQPSDITATLSRLSGYSVYAFEEELKNGYITLQGGHRAGICGKTVVENGQVKSIRNISAMNIRIAHEIEGCSDKVLPYLFVHRQVCHTLIVSPPGCGKTTLLRDIVRNLSNGVKESGGRGYTIGLVDERSELAGSFMGIPQNDVGMRTDVLDGCPKAQGMLMLVRSMAPEVIAADEIGKREDVDAIENIVSAGIKLICSVHGRDREDIEGKPFLGKLIKEKVFQRIIFLNNTKRPGTIAGVYDENFSPLYMGVG